MAELKNIIIRKDGPKNKTSDRIISIVEKILNFNRKKKVKDSKQWLLNKCYKDYQ